MGVVGLAENKANSAQLELEAGAELGNFFQNFVTSLVLNASLNELGLPQPILVMKL